MADYKPGRVVPGEQVHIYWDEAWERAGLCVDAFSPTALPSSSPTSSPTTGPTQTPLKRILVDSFLEWNIDCNELSTNATALSELFKVIEASVYNGIDAQLSSGESVESVVVNELCGVNLNGNSGSSSGRLSGSLSTVSVSAVVSKACADCQESMFSSFNAAFESIVKDGSLVREIQSQLTLVMSYLVIQSSRLSAP